MPDERETIAALEAAKAVAEEWVTPMRLSHVLDKIPGAGLKETGKVVEAMLADVLREGAGEFDVSDEICKEVKRAASSLFRGSLTFEPGPQGVSE